MKQEGNIDGLNRRHIAQIIRRNMITRTKPSSKIYSRKKERRDLDS
jgi:hypothetical protein